MSENRLNWAQNLEYSAKRILAPESTGEVQELVCGALKAKALGTRHSFSEIADCEGTLISTEKLNRVLEIDRQSMSVRIQAGIRYGELSQELDEHGFALHNLASLPHISVAGACATATHGSGVANGSLSSAVRALSIVSADGSIMSFSRDDATELFSGVVVSLGGLGVVTELTLDIQPSFAMTQTVYDELPFSTLEHNFDEIMSCATSVSLFTHWKGPTIDQVWVKSRVDSSGTNSDLTRFGAKKADDKRSPLPNGAVENCTDQLGVPGPWWDRLPHFRLGFTPSSGEELQTEYFVSHENAWLALKLIDGIRDEVAPLLQTTEVRTIAADSFWLSPCFGRRSVAIHFTWKKDWENVSRLLPEIEGILAPFCARPHWGKLFTVEPAVLALRYPEMERFRALRDQLDPTGKFCNPFLKRNFATAPRV